jgi:hypothetical protein
MLQLLSQSLGHGDAADVATSGNGHDGHLLTSPRRAEAIRRLAAHSTHDTTDHGERGSQHMSTMMMIYERSDEPVGLG